MRTKLFGVVILLAGFMYGCSELVNNDDFETNQTGSVIISLTDAPFPSDLVEEANVFIDWIKLKKAEADSTGSDSDSLFIKIEVKDTFNLLELSNGISTVLGELDSVPVGRYNEIRMHVVDANIKLKNGSEFDLKIPSGNSSGLKIKIEPALIVEGGSAPLEVMLDFDASRSFIVKGNSNGKGNDKEIKGFMFKPVIRASNMSFTGNIYGVVSDNITDEKIKNAHLYLISGTEPDLDTIASAKTTEEGYYKIIGVPANTYVLSCEKDGYDSAQTEIFVAIREELNQDFSITKSTDE